MRGFLLFVAGAPMAAIPAGASPPVPGLAEAARIWSGGMPAA